MLQRLSTDDNGTFREPVQLNDMSAVAVETLVQPIAGDAPCGEDLAYKGIDKLEELAAGKPERRIGDTSIPGEEPDWEAVKKQALELFSKSKDLRVAALLTQAMVRTDGLEGLCTGLDVVSRLLGAHWESLHPQPDAPGDYTIRLNALSFLSDLQRLLNPIRRAQLVAAPAHGRFALRDIQIASGKLKAPAGEAPAQPAAIEAAFRECDIARLESTLQAVERSLAHVKSIDDKWTEHVGSHDVDVTKITPLLQDIRKELQAALASHPKAKAEPVGDSAGGGHDGPAQAATQPQLNGVLRSRDDVIRALDSACEYLAKHEPSSPVPLLLQRAKRLMEKDFLQIIQDLAPGAMTEVAKISGTDSKA